jgi:hypothetical protein
MTFGHLLDDRPEKAVFPLEPALVFRDEPLEMMEKYPVEKSAFRMTGAIDSRHIGTKYQETRQEREKAKIQGQRQEMAPGTPQKAPKTSTSVDARRSYKFRNSLKYAARRRRGKI